MSFVSKIMCWTFLRGDEKRDAGLKTPENVVRFDDIQYGDDPKWNLLDVYRPKGVEGKLPVIVSVHGGGWVYGDKERYQYYCMSLVKHGFAVVNFTYRLAPQYKYPAQMEDTDRVFEWVQANAEEYGFDLNNVFAVGDSAGGHLLSLYCCLCNDAELAERSKLNMKGKLPKAVALNCGVYLIDKPKKPGMISAVMKDLLPNKGTEEELNLISPMEHITSDFPPAIVMTAEGDFLKEMAQPMADRLKEAGVPVEYMYYGDEDHVLRHVFHVNMNLEEAAVCNKDECDFFKSFI